MATFTNVGTRVRAQIRRKGQPSLAMTHDTMEEAQKWVRKMEVDIDSGKKVGVHGKTGMTFGEAVDRYIKEDKTLGKTTVDILGYLKKDLGKIMLHKMTDQDIFSYIQNKNFSPMSGAMHFSFFRSVITMAQVIWEYHVADILPSAQKKLKLKGLIGTSQERDRRPSLEEIDMLLSYKFPTPIPMNDIIQFAISSAMRQAEIMRIEHTTVKPPRNEGEKTTVLITDRKHPTKKKGNHQEVPLLDESIEIISRQKRKEGDDRIFPFSPATIGTYFTAACKKLGIVDLHFHDLRHEAASRLFEMGYQIHEVAKFTGHEDWKMLQRYTHLKSKNVRSLEAKKIDPPKVEIVAGEMDAETMKQFKQFQAMLAMMKQTEAA